MLNGQKIIDADAHVREPGDLLLKWLEPKYKDRAPQFVPGGTGGYRYGDEEWPQRVSGSMGAGSMEFLETTFKEYFEAGWNRESQLKAMDWYGLDMAFLYPTHGLHLWFFRSMDAEIGGALVRAYNNWIQEFSQIDPQRLRPVAGLDLRDPSAAVEELRRVGKLGIRAVWVRPNPVNDRLLNSADYEPLWAACEEMDVPVGVHEGSPSPVPAVGADRFDTYFGRHACSHPMEQMMAFLALVEGGVLERHPKLRISFLEAGCGWLPYWLFRLDAEYKNRKSEVGDRVKMNPSEYFRRQCYVSCEPDEPYLPALIDYIGEDKLLFASDYPHADHGPEIMEDLAKLDGKISKQAFRKLIWDNPRAYYSLD